MSGSTTSENQKGESVQNETLKTVDMAKLTGSPEDASGKTTSKPKGFHPATKHIKYPVGVRPGTIFWSQEEDDRLIELVMLHGKNWRLMHDYFPTRSESSIKCRWHVYLKQHVKGEPPPHKRYTSSGQVKRSMGASSSSRPRKRARKPKILSELNADATYGGSYIESQGVRKSSRHRSKPKVQYIPDFVDEYGLSSRQKAKNRLGLSKSIRGHHRSGLSKNFTETFRAPLMSPKSLERQVAECLAWVSSSRPINQDSICDNQYLKSITSKRDSELTIEERKSLYPMFATENDGTPVVSKLVGISCLASKFFTEKVGNFTQRSKRMPPPSSYPPLELLPRVSGQAMPNIFSSNFRPTKHGRGFQLPPIFSNIIVKGGQYYGVTPRGLYPFSRHMRPLLPRIPAPRNSIESRGKENQIEQSSKDRTAASFEKNVSQEKAILEGTVHANKLQNVTGTVCGEKSA